MYLKQSWKKKFSFKTGLPVDFYGFDKHVYIRKK